jgi:hypothetical protein
VPTTQESSHRGEQQIADGQVRKQNFYGLEL